MFPITARVAWITPSTLTWRMRATCSLSYVSSVPCQLTPALDVDVRQRAKAPHGEQLAGARGEGRVALG